LKAITVEKIEALQAWQQSHGACSELLPTEDASKIDEREEQIS